MARLPLDPDLVFGLPYVPPRLPGGERPEGTRNGETFTLTVRREDGTTHVRTLERTDGTLRAAVDGAGTWDIFRVDPTRIARAVEADGGRPLLLRNVTGAAPFDDAHLETTYLFHAFDPADGDVAHFRTTDTAGATRLYEGFIGMRREGPRLERLESDGVLPYETMAGALEPIDGAAGSGLDDALAIRPAGSPVVLLIPASDPMLWLHHDDDGAFVQLTVSDRASTLRSLARTELFERRWDHLGDERMASVEADVAREIARLEARIADTLAHDGGTR